MSVQNVSPVGNLSFQSNIQKTTESKTAPSEIKDGKKKLTLALVGLATVGIATIGIIHLAKKGKVQEVQEEGQQLIQKTHELAQKPTQKIQGLTEGEKIPYTNNNKLRGRTTNKFYATFNGQDVVVEQKIKAIPHKGLDNYAFIRDKQTGELVTVKRVNSDGSELPFLDLRKSKGVHKTNLTSLNEDGNQVRKTFKNGELYSTQTTILNPDNSKRIIVEYAKLHEGSTIIEISADGTRSIVQKAETVFDV